MRKDTGCEVSCTIQNVRKISCNQFKVLGYVYFMLRYVDISGRELGFISCHTISSALFMIWRLASDL